MFAALAPARRLPRNISSCPRSSLAFANFQRTNHAGHNTSNSRGDLKQVGDSLGVEELVL